MRLELVVRVSIIDPDQWTGAIQDETTTALTNYLNGLQPFIEGLDPVYGATTEITAVNLSDVIQAVTVRYGVNAASVSFELSGNVTPLTRLPLPAGTIPLLTNAYYPEAV
jgi:hypothetical protein